MLHVRLSCKALCPSGLPGTFLPLCYAVQSHQPVVGSKHTYALPPLYFKVVSVDVILEQGKHHFWFSGSGRLQVFYGRSSPTLALETCTPFYPKMTALQDAACLGTPLQKSV